MKKILLLITILSILVISPAVSEARGREHSYGSSGYTNSSHSRVSGYTKSNGTHVSGYSRTSPNSTKRDNYSTKGNINPYTGKAGTIDPYK